jgi:hypothetical protein
MTNHDRKEPPLQEKVNHNRKRLSSILYYVSMLGWVAMIAIALAGVFDV